MALKIWSAGEILTAADLNGNFSQVSPAAAILRPDPIYPHNAGTHEIIASSNTTGYLAGFVIPTSIVLNKVSFYIPTVTASGTVKIGIYSPNGQSRLLNDTTGTISAASAIYTHTLSAALTLTAGQYYFVIVPISTANIRFTTYNPLSTIAAALNPLASEPKLYGTMTVTAGTLPTTFNTSSDVTDSTNGTLPIMRFDS